MSRVRPATKPSGRRGPRRDPAHQESSGFCGRADTNPTYVAKNPDVQRLTASGKRFSRAEQNDEYKKIVQKISLLVGSAGVSIEVFADFVTSAELMLAQGEEMFAWIPDAYIKYACIHEGHRPANMSVERGMRVNMTLCFSQEQAAAVYASTRGAKEAVYVSPFVGRLDDRGEDGMSLVRNIREMYAAGDGLVHVVAASFRKLDHLLESFAFGAELATSPAKILEQWAADGFPLADQNFRYKAVDSKGGALRPIPYKELNLSASWDSFDLEHELTDKGIERFVNDYKSTLKSAA